MHRQQLILVGIASVFMMSAVPVLVKSTSANEYTIGIFRLAIAIVALSPMVLMRGKLRELSRRQWLQLAIIGVVFGCHWLLYFFSIKLATAAIAALTITTYSVQYLILAWLFNGERVAPIEWLAIALCFAGCVIVSPGLSLQNQVSMGIAIGLVSALFYAALPLLHQRAQGIGTLERTWGQFFFALIIFLPLWDLTDWKLSTTDYYQLLALGVVCTLFAHGLWVKSSTELPALHSGMIYYLYLPGALTSSAIFLDEPFTARKLLGCALVLSASAGLTVYRYQRSRRAIAS
ncbi:DMT family transporter [Haliea sp. E17]|uniref:DMT family transporter n=1 Tax=Haliea sp. E17 TaxID=3401576 RepID=UPI003AAAC884